MSDSNYFLMEARPQITAFVAPSGDLQINVTQIKDGQDKVEFTSIELPLECAQPLAEAILRIAKASIER